MVTEPATQVKATRRRNGPHCASRAALTGRVSASGSAGRRAWRSATSRIDRGGERHQRDQERAAHAQRGERGGHDQGSEGITDAAAHREHAHVGVDPARRDAPRPPRAFRVDRGDAGAGDDDGRQGHRVAVDDAHGGDAQAGEDEPHGHQPEAGAPVPVRAEQRLQHRGGDARREREHAHRRVAVVALDDQERQQRPQGGGAEVGGPVPERQGEQREARGGRGRRDCAHLSAPSRIAAHDSTTGLCAGPPVPTRGTRAGAVLRGTPGAWRGSWIRSGGCARA